ncbi:(Fe-S)-binding protein [Agriterribacter sp.]|uniref:(Fe-S)-binding protein n=1 Tax=Agriterribacter sp. TaxID=2821509 RepID=UPI002C6F2878|nr:(Fe-S)-binding protein [Agriterribacter sp.]HRO46021.1 (Fe-S)-binding protein [Agriterribacter sp.]HRQ17057.1 (Fe-S)-binding protein [Agriterribacter sp.]
MDVQLFVPCFIDQLYPQTAFNMIKVLEKLGCNVHYNTNQTCCGQPAFNAGFRDDARDVCHKFLTDFSGSGYIVSPGASCTGFVKNYYPLLFDNSSLHNEVKDTGKRMFEFSAFLTDILKVEDVGAEFYGKATYHDSCAALRELHIKSAPRRLLNHVKGLELVEMNDVETCCGFGGTFAIKFETIAVAMGDQKVVNAGNTGAGYIISTDMSCLMHLDGVIKHKGLAIQTMHIADVLASGW